MLLYLILLYNIHIHIHILLYYYIIHTLLYLLLYSIINLLFFCSLFPSLPSSSVLLIQSIRVGTYIRVFIFRCSFFPFFPFPSSPPNIHSIRVGIWIRLFISHPNIRPRMFYRSGWLRCVVRKCMLESCCVLCSGWWDVY